MQRIIEIYRRNGRFDVRVEPKIIELPNNRVDLVFEINEGGKTGVKQAHLRRQQRRIRDSRLKDEIKTPETIPLIGFLQTPGHLRSRPHRGRPRPAAPLLSEERLCRRAHRVRGRRVYDPAQKGFIVTFTIEEGERYRFGKVEITRTCAAVDAKSLYGRGCGPRRRRLQRRGGREDRSRTSTIEVARARLSVRGRASARRPRLRDSNRST